MVVRRTAALAAALLFVVLAQGRDSWQLHAAPSTSLVISQVYGGGGNSGAPYTHDFVEIHNISAAPVSLNGLSIQYASATGTGSFGANEGQLVALPDRMLPPGGYFLVQFAGGTTGAPLPSPDLIDATPIAMSATAGKVALVTGPESLGCNGGSTPCSAAALARIIDLIGYGNANFFEGAAVPTLSNTTAAIRRGAERQQDTDSNAADFEVLPPSPRNTRWGVSIDDVTVIEGNSGEVTATFTVSVSEGHRGVTFDIATADGTATVGDGDYFANAATGVAIPAGTLTTTFQVQVSGDVTIEPAETFFARLSNVAGAPVGDAEGVGTISNDDDAAAPVITGQPASTSILVGESATLSVEATGTAPLAYQWYEGTSGTTGQPVGADSPSFTTPALSASTSYWVRVSNTAGTADSATATVTVVPPPPICSANDRPIGEVQGPANASSFVGQTVTIQGVVVGDFEGPAPALRGFYLQDAGDSDPATSDGVFVFNGNTNSVALGQVVQVTGTVNEFQDQTQLTATAIQSCGETGTVATVDVTLPVPEPVAGVPYLERFEGMLVRFPQTLTVTEHFQLGRFGQVVMSANGRLPQPTNVVAPGAAAGALQAANDRNRIIVDDALQNQNADPILFGRDGTELTAANTLRGGDTATAIVGVMTYTWAGNSASGNAYRLRPVNALGGGVPDFEPANPRPTAPPSVGGRLKVASFNVLNYFLTLDVGTQANCGPAGSRQECRGAETSTELARQRAKLTSALVKLDADIVGLVELENTDGVNPLEAIVSDLNARLGAGTYAYVDTGVVGTDAIRVGFIYKPASAALAGAPLIDGASVHNRPPVAQVFTEVGTGEQFSAVINHFKSKGCEGATGPDTDQGDGQGCFNATRVAQAQALLAFIAGEVIPSAADPDVLLLGDFNAYAKEEPIAVLEGAGYTNLVAVFGGDAAYSYVFDGQWGYLDHALASASLTPQATGAADYHINADEPSVLDYNTNFKSARHVDLLYAPDEFRTSDHDPVLVGLALSSSVDLSASVVAATDTVDAGGTVTFNVTVTNTGTSPARNVVISDGAATLAALPVLGPGASYRVTFTRASTCEMPNGSLLAGVATVTADTADPDGTNNMATALVTVNNAAPVLTGLTASRTTLWPPVHLLVPVNVAFTASDTCGAVTTKLTVTSNEPVTGPLRTQGLAGLTSPDWRVVDADTVLLRAERSATGTGRIYTVTVTATDAAGAITTGSVSVTVPRRGSGWRDDD